jgi:hypothetical protein
LSKQQRLNWLGAFAALIFTTIILASFLFTSSPAEAKSQTATSTVTFDSKANAVKQIESQAPELKDRVLRLALKAYDKARAQGLDDQQLLSVIDYSDPSTQKRLWVLDMQHDTVLYHTLVAHGKASGANYAHYFSDRHSSDASSLGVFLTAKTYHDHHGLAMRLKGLDPGFNDQVYSRNVVMHSAWYVSQDFINKHGRLGRSFGCPALSKQVEPQVVNTIKNGSLLFVYYPDSNWLSHSKYLA